MTETKPKRTIFLPAYTLGEELFNAISHGIGALLSVAALILMLIKARGALPIVASALFGAAMIALYTISCVYHALSRRVKGKKVLRVIDHCNVFLLVLGTYVPVALLGVGGAAGWLLLGLIFAADATGIALTAVNVDRFKGAGVACHLIGGWAVLIAVPRLLAVMGPGGVTALILGGVMYTIGSILYGLGARKRYMHCVFHVFCLLGTFFHFVAVYMYLL
ncbi:MAG: hemolysin III family protein [Clostridia bacterium]|nr:hemolysin III family protein [Clostridia bacterium]